MKLKTKELALLLSFIVICLAPLVRANPLLVSWYITVTDPVGTPIDGAHLTIYWATSTDGPFTAMDSSIVEDKIANTYQNPIVTGFWNPDHPHGMGVADLRITNVENYYFYVKIEFPDGTIQYLPEANSIKPADSSWKPVSAIGSPSGYAASGNGFGNGPTSAYPNNLPPPPQVPEVPFGTIVSFLSMVTVLVGFIGFRRFRSKSH